ncbi:hypothetical protein LTR66_009444 [Elasticomyces elasticus]|nr:hypothetical protein LTR66_009444 [Elasticomyces elasticus]
MAGLPFRVFYSTTYTVLFVLTIIALAITPTSLIYQAVYFGAWQYVFIIGGVYLLTVVLVIFIYSSRLYTNRSVLAGVGKSFLPIEKGEVGSSVRKMIEGNLAKSAMIAWESRPRDLNREAGEVAAHPEPLTMDGDRTLFQPHEEQDRTQPLGTFIKIDPKAPPWGNIEHPGWSSPSPSVGNSMPNLQFIAVIPELPNLIEAKAVALAPLVSTSDTMLDSDMAVAEAMPDEHVMTLLQRPSTMGLRDYLSSLADIDIINPPELADAFILQYEYARFSGQALTPTQFNNLMASFADVLTSMIELHPAIVKALSDKEQTPAMKLKEASSSETASLTPSASSASPSGSVLHRHPSNPVSTRSLRTAPSYLRGVSAASRALSGKPSQDSFSSVIHNTSSRAIEYARSLSSSNGSLSLRSAQSVIRLAPESGSGGLPYEWATEGG